jgi:carbamoyltransferase
MSDIIILGIHGFSSNSDKKLHDCGAALIKDGKIIAAINEERLTRIKYDGSFPFRSISEVLRIANVTPDDVTYIALSEMPPLKQSYEIIKMIIKTFKETGIFQLGNIFKAIRRGRHRRRLPRDFKNITFSFVSHHISHAASAYYTSPWNRATVITLDGMGDHCIGGSISKGENGKIEVKKYTNGFYSPGIFYNVITKYLGFKPNRHEGKVTGLAAYGDPEKCYSSMEKIISYSPHKIDFYAPLLVKVPQCWDISFAHKLLNDYSPEDIAASAQKRLEDVVIPFIKDAVKIVGIPKVVLAGGVFANVKLNQKIFELPEVDDIYIHPNMGDGGISVGAALYIYHNVFRSNEYFPIYLENLYLGPEYSDYEVRREIERHGLTFQKIDNIEERIAKLLAEGKIIGRFCGRMEYGPRALGNRSILASPTDIDINNWLNKRLKRTEFMPFAPSILEEYAKDYYPMWNIDDLPSRFMTITYNVSSYGRDMAPAVCHIDGTARPQVVGKRDNESYYNILRHYLKVKGLPIFVNTSFNMHEEPIVCGPDDAIRAFKEGACDILAIGDYIVYGF